jgi:hypothetical protein
MCGMKATEFVFFFFFPFFMVITGYTLSDQLQIGKGAVSGNLIAHSTRRLESTSGRPSGVETRIYRRSAFVSKSGTSCREACLYATRDCSEDGGANEFVPSEASSSHAVQVGQGRQRCLSTGPDRGTAIRPPLCSSGQSSWLLNQRSRARFPALPDFLSSCGSGTGSTQPL